MPSEDRSAVGRRSVLRTVSADPSFSRTATGGGVLTPEDSQFRCDELDRQLRALRGSYEAFVSVSA